MTVVYYVYLYLLYNRITQVGQGSTSMNNLDNLVNSCILHIWLVCKERIADFRLVHFSCSKKVVISSSVGAGTSDVAGWGVVGVQWFIVVSLIVALSFGLVKSMSVIRDGSTYIYIKCNIISTSNCTKKVVFTCLQKVWFQLHDWEVTAVYPFRTAYSTLNSTAVTCECA